jgi:hypothetical protein
VCQICLLYKELGMSVLVIIILATTLTGFKDKDEHRGHGGCTDGHGERQKTKYRVLRCAQDDEFCAGWEGERRTVWGEKFEW